MPPLSPDLQVTFAQLIPALQGWRASTDSFSQHSQLRKYIAECDTLITNEDIRNEGARIIQEAEKGTQLSIMQFTLARDYLLCNLALATATDPAPSTTSWSQIMRHPGLVRQTELSSCLSTRRRRAAPAMLGMNPQMQAQMTTLYCREKRILHVTQIKIKKKSITSTSQVITSIRYM